MVYTNADVLNSVVLWIFKLGSIIQLVLIILILRSIYKILVNLLRYGFRGLANGYKLIVVVGFILFCFLLYQNPEVLVEPVTEFDYDTFNPFEVNWDFSGSNSYTNGGESNSDYNDGDNSQSTPTKPEIDVSELEYEIHILINNERQTYGLATLEYDAELADIARAHSQDMANRNYFDHNNPEGQGPTERAKAAGYNCYKDFGSYYTDGIAENIFQNWLYDSITYYNGIPVYDWCSQSEIASSTVSGWMASPGHRENILTSTYDKEGMGVAISSDYKVYITQDFW